jgi:DNA-binding transcriptional ArsR family regulator
MDVFAALADPVRRELLLQIARAPARVVDLAAERPISRPAVSRHLRLLTDAGLATADDQGRERHYRAVPAGLAPVRGLLEELTGPTPPIAERMLDGLDLEVRRTGKERRAAAPTHQEETG